MSERHACRLMGLGRSRYGYRARKAERDSALRAGLKELAAKRMRFGYRRLTVMLAREGILVNHKRVYRLYREEGLAMRIRQKRRIRENAPPLRSTPQWVDYECAEYWMGSLANEACPKRSCWTMARSFVGERWPHGAKNAGCGWNSFSRVSQLRMLTQKASTVDWGMNA
jgi:putative transposase